MTTTTWATEPGPPHAMRTPKQIVVFLATSDRRCQLPCGLQVRRSPPIRRTGGARSVPPLRAYREEMTCCETKPMRNQNENESHRTLAQPRPKYLARQPHPRS